MSLIDPQPRWLNAIAPGRAIDSVLQTYTGMRIEYTSRGPLVAASAIVDAASSAGTLVLSATVSAKIPFRSWVYHASSDLALAGGAAAPMAARVSFREYEEKDDYGSVLNSWRVEVESLVRRRSSGEAETFAMPEDLPAPLLNPLTLLIALGQTLGASESVFAAQMVAGSRFHALRLRHITSSAAPNSLLTFEGHIVGIERPLPSTDAFQALNWASAERFEILWRSGDPVVQAIRYSRAPLGTLEIVLNEQLGC